MMTEEQKRVEEIRKRLSDGWFVYNPNSEATDSVQFLLDHIDALQVKLILAEEALEYCTTGAPYSGKVCRDALIRMGKTQ